MHLSGVNFAGPATNLDERLTSTDAYKEWSKPVDRVDNAAYHHDLAYKYFTDTVGYEMVNKYNNTKHSSIKMTPVAASDKKNENTVWLNLNGKVQSEPVKPKFPISDKVRITKKKVTFEKGYTPRWTEEVFTVSQIQFTDPPTYKITDDNGDEIHSSLYEEEIQKINQKIFRIEKVVCKLIKKSLVKWYGYPETFISWVDNKELISL
ncbi:uncharacterized protein LOC136091869 [Hydra vulgaris]|uniref:Uncharacterized protein LOC136091869 n=1 Tax=Hydra vulgaris TaxID=6087 RepID=A0ABM4DM68_HYDVU